MKRRLPWILFGLSVALNVSFIVGFLRARDVLRELQTSEGRARWAARQLKLDASQRAAFESIHREWRDEMRGIQQRYAADADALWAGMLRDEDPQRLATGLERLLEAQKSATARSLDHLRRALRVLTPEQRQAFAQMLRARTRL